MRTRIPVVVHVGALLIVLGCSAGIVLSACHAPVNIKTPQGQAAYTAQNVLMAVGTLQHEAIRANATILKTGRPALSTSNARLVVQTTTQIEQELLTIIENAGQGRTGVYKDMQALLVRLSSVLGGEYPAVKQYVDAVLGIVAALVPSGDEFEAFLQLVPSLDRATVVRLLAEWEPPAPAR